MMAVWGKATVFKLQDFALTDTRTREALIDTNQKWKEFSQNCYLPWYTGPDWCVPDSLNWGLTEYSRKFPALLTQREDLLILTAYHSLLGKRVIIDGAHRAVALDSEVNAGRDIPPVKVLECFGTQIHGILPADFCNLIVKALRKEW